MPTTTTYTNCTPCCGVAGCCTPDPPDTLYATFAGALAAMGTVTLTLDPGTNPPTWIGTSSSDCGEKTINFSCNPEADPAEYVMSASSVDPFTQDSLVCDPFHWTGTSPNAVSPCSGESTVDVTETPP